MEVKCETPCFSRRLSRHRRGVGRTRRADRPAGTGVTDTPPSAGSNNSTQVRAEEVASTVSESLFEKSL